LIISIASGKGGTGKTTVALLLATSNPAATVLDCDVEEPNCHLFLEPEWEEEYPVEIMIPQLDNAKCVGCGRCSEVCLFNAIAVGNDKALLFDELCHSCGGCLLVCPNGAWSEARKTIGIVKRGRATKVAPAAYMISGTLTIGVPNAGPLIKAMKKLHQFGDVVVDCPPGTSCSMVAGVSGSDYCLLVTEPTPFGLHDLKLAVGITKLLQIPAGVVINKSDGGAGDEEIAEFCKKQCVELIGRIPHDRDLAMQYSQGTISRKYQNTADDIWRAATKAGVAK
jgi:MinD superfamily P-loop ATPase